MLRWTPMREFSYLNLIISENVVIYVVMDASERVKLS